jgi:cytochrome c oxidase cbb3-type subunit 1
MLLMAYNMLKTIVGKPAVDAPIPASIPAAAH